MEHGSTTGDVDAGTTNLAWNYYSGVNHRTVRLIRSAARTILDVGCGTGSLGVELMRLRPSREVWGIELVPEVAAVAQARLHHVVCGDIERMLPLPLPHGYFDAIVFGDVLEHLREPSTLLKRVRRHLSPEGEIVCCVPNVGHWSVVAALLAGEFRYEDAGLLDRTHLRFFTPASFRRTLADGGYRIVAEDVQPIDNPAVVSTLASVAERVGVSRSGAEDCLTTYQRLFVAKSDPTSPSLGVDASHESGAISEGEEELEGLPMPTFVASRVGLLVGSHAGSLPPATVPQSVVIVTYNSEALIEACVASLAPQLGADDEIIVVDNASHDGTRAATQRICSADTRVSTILNEENAGYARAANQGIRASKGARILLLNPDAALGPTSLSAMASALEPGVGAVGPLADNVAGLQFVGHHLPPGLKTTMANLPVVVERIFGERRIESKMLMGLCIMLTRELLNGVGLLDENCELGADDLELSWRLRTLGLKLTIAMGAYCGHVGSASFDTLPNEDRLRRQRRSDAALVKKLIAFYGSDPLPTSWDMFGSDLFEDALRRHLEDGDASSPNPSSLPARKNAPNL